MRIRLLFSLLCLALVGCGPEESIRRTDKPISREAASQELAVPLPPSARDFYFVFHSAGLQDLQMFVRFTVDAKDLDGAVADILSDHDKKLASHFSYPKLSLAAAPRAPVFPELQPMPWWNTDSITNGFYRGTTNGQPFHVWVDVDQHTIYLCAHD